MNFIDFPGSLGLLHLLKDGEALHFCFYRETGLFLKGRTAFPRPYEEISSWEVFFAVSL